MQALVRANVFELDKTKRPTRDVLTRCSCEPHRPVGVDGWRIEIEAL